MSKTYKVSEYHSNGALSDTEYAFSDGVTFKVWEANPATGRRRAVSLQEFPGNHFVRSGKGKLEAAMRGCEQDGETEILHFNFPVKP